MSLWCDDFYATPQGYYVIKVYQGFYVTVTLTNHRPFQNRPTLDAKKMHFLLIGESWEHDIRNQRVENYRLKKK